MTEFSFHFLSHNHVVNYYANYVMKQNKMMPKYTRFGELDYRF